MIKPEHQNIRERILSLAARFKIADLKKGGKLARALGVHNSVIKRLIENQSLPALDNLNKICEKAGVSADWVLTGREPEPKTEIQVLEPRLLFSGLPQDLPPEVRGLNYRSIPRVAGFIGAGYEGAVPWDYCDGLVLVPESELGNHAGHDLRAIRVARQAISMIPTIRPGDIVIIDPQDRPDLPLRPADKKAIWAVRYPEGDNAALKRVREADDHWVLLSDNHLIDPILIKKAEIPDLIIGRVIWSWTKWIKS